MGRLAFITQTAALRHTQQTTFETKGIFKSSLCYNSGIEGEGGIQGNKKISLNTLLSLNMPKVESSSLSLIFSFSFKVYNFGTTRFYIL